MASILAVVALILFFIYAGLILYYRHGWKTIPVFEPAPDSVPATRLSVIIPARNEEKAIGACLQAIGRQSYPLDLFEVIVVDDHSTDNTIEVVRTSAASNVRCISLSDFVKDPINSYKKKAIEVAIGLSTGDLIVITDADCFMGPDWLSSIAGFYEQTRAAFIAAPVCIESGSRFLEVFQAVDFMTLQGITGASVSRKLHSMCNGANLAYEKKAFFEVDGFSGIDGIASGDDMLLMHKINERYPQRVHYLKSPKAIVQTAPAATLEAFLNQRIRWASKADKYEDQSILPVLITVYFLNVLLFVLPIWAIFQNTLFTVRDVNFSLIVYWAVLVLAKTGIELLFLFPVALFFGKIHLLTLFLPMQPFHIVYTVTAGWLGKFGSYQWKGRKVK